MADSSKSSSYKSHKATSADLSILEKLDTIPAMLGVCKLTPLPTKLQLGTKLILEKWPTHSLLFSRDHCILDRIHITDM